MSSLVSPDQYRVVLFDPNVPRPERPVQAFFNNVGSASNWAQCQLSRAGVGSEVWLYRIEEKLEGSYKKKTLEKPVEVIDNMNIVSTAIQKP